MSHSNRLDSTQIRAANRLLDALDDEESRSQVSSNRRTQKRHHCRIIVTLSVLQEPGGKSSGPQFIRAFVRNISAMGLSFIQKAGLPQASVTLLFGSVMRRCVPAKIVRCRNIVGGLCEYAVTFETRLADEELADLRSPTAAPIGQK